MKPMLETLESRDAPSGVSPQFAQGSQMLEVKVESEQPALFGVMNAAPASMQPAMQQMETQFTDVMQTWTSTLDYVYESIPANEQTALTDALFTFAGDDMWSPADQATLGSMNAAPSGFGALGLSLL